LILLPSSIFLSSLFLIGEARGDEFRLVPSVGLKEEYNDNLFFTEGDKTTDFLTTLSPGLELITRTERLDLNLSTRVSGLIYGSNEDLNAVDHNHRGRLLYALHPKLKVSADAGFLKSSSPDQELEATGLVTKVTKLYKYNFGGGLEYTFTEKTRADLSYFYEKYDYPGDPELVDSTGHNASVGFIHDLNQYISNTAGRMNFGYAQYEFRDTTTQYYYFTIGMNRALNEKWSLLLDAGPSYTRSEFEVLRIEPVPPSSFRTVTDKETEKGTGWFGQAALSYQGEKTTANVTFSNRLAPASGTVGVTERTSLILDLTHRWTYELSVGLSAGYYLNKSERGEFSRAGIDEETFRISPRVRWELSKDVALEGSYNYTSVKDKLADTESKRNLFMLSFVVKFPLFE
jgi:hypothetical protein